jgi:excisionase family DNA binding protein
MRIPREQRPATSFLTIREVAERLKVSQRTVRRWIDRGHLHVVKLGRTVRIDEESLNSLILTNSRVARRRSRAAEIAPFSALAEGAFARTWDNPADAVYDQWREIYGLRKGRRRAGRLSVPR